MEEMSDLPSPARSGEYAIEARPPRQAGLVLTPAEKVARRRNRRLLLAITIPSVAVLVIALIASGVAESNLPNGPKVAVPAGYQLANDGYFSYAVPGSWKVNQLYTDSTGDAYRSGPAGWAGEHIGFRTSAPTLGEAQPSSLAAFGMDRPTPYNLSGGHPITVRGAGSAFSYSLTRPGGFTATAVDAWNPQSGVEIWLIVRASPDVAQRILGSLSS